MSAAEKYPETFEIGKKDGRPFIKCLGCDLTSFLARDIEQHYCGRCHVWHDHLYPPARPWFISETPKIGKLVATILIFLLCGNYAQALTLRWNPAPPQDCVTHYLVYEKVKLRWKVISPMLWWKTTFEIDLPRGKHVIAVSSVSEMGLESVRSEPKIVTVK